MASFDPKNVTASADVSVRAAARADFEDLRRWGWHREPYLAEYNMPLLSEHDLDLLWGKLTGTANQLLYHGFCGPVLIAQIKLRKLDRAGGCAELGIMMDPRFVGRGLGKAIVTQTIAIAFADLGLGIIRLEVAAYNLRAVAAYRACGFAETSRRWVQLDSRTDFAALLRDPQYAWLAQWVRVDAGITRILVLAMEARQHV